MARRRYGDPLSTENKLRGQRRGDPGQAGRADPRPEYDARTAIGDCQEGGG